MLKNLKDKMFPAAQDKTLTSTDIEERVARLGEEERGLHAQFAAEQKRIRAANTAVETAEEDFVAGRISSADLTTRRTTQMDIVRDAESKKVTIQTHLELLSKAFQTARKKLAEVSEAEQIAAARQKLNEHSEWRRRFSTKLVELLELNTEGQAIEAEITRQHPAAMREVHVRIEGTAGHFHRIGSISELALPLGPGLLWLRSVAAAAPESLSDEAHAYLDQVLIEERSERQRRQERAAAIRRSAAAASNWENAAKPLSEYTHAEVN